MNKKQIDKIMSSFTIIMDSREKRPSTISKTFDNHNIRYIVSKLDFGDYTAYVEYEGVLETPLFSTISIERKQSINELGNNLSNARERFKREYERAKDADNEIILMIEGDTYSDIVNVNYRNKVNPKSYLASLHSITNSHFIFIDPKYSALFIYKTLYYNIYNQLKKL